MLKNETFLVIFKHHAEGPLSNRCFFENVNSTTWSSLDTKMLFQQNNGSATVHHGLEEFDEQLLMSSLTTCDERFVLFVINTTTLAVVQLLLFFFFFIGVKVNVNDDNIDALSAT